MSLHATISDQQEQRQWDMSVVQEERSQLECAVAVRDRRMKPPALSTRACGRVSTWTQGQAVVAREAMASMRFASVHMAGTSAGAGGWWYRGCGSMPLGHGVGGRLVRRESWSWLEASLMFGWVRGAACDRTRCMVFVARPCCRSPGGG
jgi:hypothetical protein